jgi:hypothetical protein
LLARIVLEQIYILFTAGNVRDVSKRHLKDARDWESASGLSPAPLKQSRTRIKLGRNTEAQLLEGDDQGAFSRYMAAPKLISILY